MAWLSDAGAWEARLVFTRALALIYLIAFLAARNQFRGLLGSHGLLPIPSFVARASFRRSPSLFQLRYSDALFEACCWCGVVFAAAVLVGVVDLAPLWVWLAVWLVIWALYQSIVNVGQIWYAFGWESLLLEAGFLAVFLGPASMAPPTLIMFALRWLLFRLEFGAGLIKLRGDPCWRDLTCLYYHHETQPMPGPLSRWFHHLPPVLHRVETLANHATQLVIVFGVFAPQPAASVCALIIAITQAYLMISGNFSWLNLLTLVLALSVLDGRWLRAVLPIDRPAHLSTPAWHTWLVVAVAVLVVVLSYRPARNLLSRHQVMNAGFDPLHLVNTYGAFGSVTRVRYEVVIDATDDPSPGPDTVWREYEFKGKPGDVRRRPRQVAPYHLRLDWLMWFVGISPSYGHPWFDRLLTALRNGDRDVLRLLRSAPLEGAPARVRARLFRYEFCTAAERRATGQWWMRTAVRELSTTD